MAVELKDAQFQLSWLLRFSAELFWGRQLKKEPERKATIIASEFDTTQLVFFKPPNIKLAKIKEESTEFDCRLIPYLF
jgi:hypothetical protein